MTRAPQVASAVARWDSSHPHASFAFTSSMSVCAVDDGGEVNDAHCPLHSLGKAPNVDRLLRAEQAVLQVGMLLALCNYRGIY